MPYAVVGGRRLYYEVGGEGETVVLVHGSFANADILEGPATALSSGFRLCGSSTCLWSCSPGWAGSSAPTSPSSFTAGRPGARVGER